MKNLDGDSEDGGADRVTLEDLFRLKRHERPPDEFWEDFDVVLKQRTLQSVVRKTSWFGFGGFRLPLLTVCATTGLAVIAIGMYFTFTMAVEDTQPIAQDVASPAMPEADDALVVVTAGIEIEGSEIREYKDGALSLSNSISSEFDTAFPSNDLHAVTSDSITYVEENLSALFAESEPSDSRTTF